LERADRESSSICLLIRTFHLPREPAPLAQQLLRKETLEARKASLVRKVGSTEQAEDRAHLESELGEIAAELEQIGEPIMPRLLADDATPETLGGLLARHGSLAVITAEAPLISNLLGRYDSAGAANLDLVCKAYAGERTQVDRRNREELLDRPLLAIMLTVQPHVLRKLVEHEVARGQGLVSRFAFALPESLLGVRRHIDVEVPRETREAWESIVQSVYSRNPLTQTTEQGSVGSVSAQEIDGVRLFLSPSAKRLLHELRVEQEPRLQEEGDLRPVADWIARHPGRIARIAGILHLADADDSTVVGEGPMSRGGAIGSYLLAHSLVALREPDEGMRRALRWLGRCEEATVTVRDLHRGPLGGRGSAERARELARSLVDLGAVRPQAGKPAPRGPGQPPSPSFDINPRLRAKALL
jgi:hypothetical protein